jgi:hypothetical protein
MRTAVHSQWKPAPPHSVSFFLIYRSYTRALLVSPSRRHLFVTPSCSYRKEWGREEFQRDGTGLHSLYTTRGPPGMFWMFWLVRLVQVLFTWSWNCFVARSRSAILPVPGHKNTPPRPRQAKLGSLPNAYPPPPPPHHHAPPYSELFSLIYITE